MPIWVWHMSELVRLKKENKAAEASCCIFETDGALLSFRVKLPVRDIMLEDLAMYSFSNETVIVSDKGAGFLNGPVLKFNADGCAKFFRGAM